MSSATITLIGFYTYNHDLFSKLDLPTGIESDLLIDNILMRGGEYEVIYSNPDLLVDLIGSWSKQWKPVFTNWMRANTAINDVAPLENYDRIENWSDSASTSEFESSSGSSSTSGSDSSQGSESLSEVGDVTGYNASSFVNNDKQTRSASSNNQAATQTSSQNTLTNNMNKTDYSTHGGRVHGNIGVTTSAKMYQEWYDVLTKYGDIYDAIATVFLQSFVIPIL